jgi:phosphoadenosine phosphosulfate reductase
VLRWAFANFQRDVEIASGFGPEGLVLIDIAARVQIDFRVFTLDTDFLFPETHAVIERIEKRYGIQVERLKSALTPADQERLHGPALWTRDPDSCCNMRKVEPLRKKLAQLRAWVTSIRRDQTAVRARARKIEWDSKFHLVKVNPIADWNSARVWRYIRFYDVPFNPLHDLNYPSVGCTHCTRAIQPGEDSRAGRWSGLEKSECGLHVQSSGGC